MCTELITYNRRNFICEKLIFFEFLIYSGTSTKVVIILMASAKLSAIYMERVHHPLSHDSHATQL